MKTIITIFLVAFIATGIFAQAPQKMSYQAVVRNANGSLAASKTVGVRISIIQGSAFGASIYVETHAPATNSNGLFTVEIGSGTPVVGTFAGINWANGPYFIKTEIDPAGGTTYSITGTQQILSVPFALYTRKSGSADSSKHALNADNAANAANSAHAVLSDSAKGAWRSHVADSVAASARITPAQLEPGGALAGQILSWNGVNWVAQDDTMLTAGNFHKSSGAMAGRVLTSDANGNGSWQDPPITGKQIVGVYPINGYSGGPYVSQTGYAFAGPTVSITITSSNDIVIGVGSIPLATATGLANNVRLGMGYQLQPSGVITNMVGGAYSIVYIGTERNPKSVVGSVTGLPPGTYLFGAIIYNSTATSINSNDYANGYIMVLR